MRSESWPITFLLDNWHRLEFIEAKQNREKRKWNIWLPTTLYALSYYFPLISNSIIIDTIM